VVGGLRVQRQRGEEKHGGWGRGDSPGDGAVPF
jgi:hypothetical protein